MKIVDAIFYWPGSRSYTARYPVFEDSLAKTKLPVLTQLIYRQQADDYPSGGIWATTSEAVEALAELRVLAKELPAEMPAADAYFARTLTDLLTASATTGNPVILHYNGLIDGAW
ncbi:hypothetical protein [Micropruina sp.]|uniref:hypothetical protein n=1 Tax=Micropruina sp. TaxID=2737536 RepID=UPI0039E45C78